MEKRKTGTGRLWSDESLGKGAGNPQCVRSHGNNLFVDECTYLWMSAAYDMSYQEHIGEAMAWEGEVLL